MCISYLLLIMLIRFVLLSKQHKTKHKEVKNTCNNNDILLNTCLGANMYIITLRNTIFK